MNTSDKGLLMAIECFDENKNSILKAGWFDADNRYPYHTIELDDDERVVGF